MLDGAKLQFYSSSPIWGKFQNNYLHLEKKIKWCKSSEAKRSQAILGICNQSILVLIPKSIFNLCSKLSKAKFKISFIWSAYVIKQSFQSKLNKFHTKIKRQNVQVSSKLGDLSPFGPKMKQYPVWSKSSKMPQKSKFSTFFPPLGSRLYSNLIDFSSYNSGQTLV